MRKVVQNLAKQLNRQQQKGQRLLSQQQIKYNYISSKKSTNFQATTKFVQYPAYYFGKSTHNVPEIADSISEGTVLELKKNVGDYIFQDEIIAVLETDKVEFEIKSPSSGEITKLFAQEQEIVEVGKPFFEVDDAAKAPEGGAPAKAQESAPTPAAQTSQPQQSQQPQQQKAQAYTPPPPPQQTQKAPQQVIQQQKAPQPPVQPPTSIAPPGSYVTRGERREPLSRMRQKISERLKDSQNTYALLTTFQECDMSNVMEIRNKYQKDFQKKHGVKLGFMSFFIKAATHGLQNQPIMNAVIDGKEVVYRDFVDISVAVATPNGLMVPVLRNCENQSFSDIEKNLIYLAEKGKSGKISLEDMAGGTFTISNGGVFGSMMGTPILNPPQSAILGMHSIINRPVVRNDKIVARPMMYLALTYDHRLIDGREAATYLKQLANEIEDPRRILLDL